MFIHIYFVNATGQSTLVYSTGANLKLGTSRTLITKHDQYKTMYTSREDEAHVYVQGLLHKFRTIIPGNTYFK